VTFYEPLASPSSLCDVCNGPIEDDCLWCSWFCDVEGCLGHHNECCDCNPRAAAEVAEGLRRLVTEAKR
jgi:hypothetical protein